MSVAERRQRERKARQELFLDVAEELARSQRLETVSIEELTRRAEFSKRTFYLYFQDKHDLLAAVALRALERLQTRIDVVLASPARPLQRIEELAWAYFDFFAEERDSFDRLLRFEEDAYHLRKVAPQEGPHAQLYVEKTQARDERIYELLREAMAEGEIHADLTPEQLLLLVWGQCAGALRVIAAREDSLESAYGISARDLFAASVRQLMRSLS